MPEKGIGRDKEGLRSQQRAELSERREKGFQPVSSSKEEHIG
jgi:hypothetical protein